MLSTCPTTDLVVAAERMRIHVCEKPVATEAGPHSLTISIGLSAQDTAGYEPPRGEELVRAADSAVFVAKANVRNRVACAPENLAATPARAEAAL